MLLKFFAYFLTKSNSILTDAAESIVNVLASGFAFYSIYLSTQPRDENHPYGHGKVEFFSAFIEGSLVMLAGILIIGKSAYNLIEPMPIGNLGWGTIIIAFTGVVNLIMGLYLIRIAKKYHSITLHADGSHLLTDTFTSAGVVLGLILMILTGYDRLDSILSIILGLYIVYTGYKLTRTSVGGLMDESDINILQEVVDTLQANRQMPWIDIHNLRTQQYGTELHIDCHMTLPYYYELTRVHQEISEVDSLINRQDMRNAELFIHADPCVPECCHYCHVENCPVRQHPFDGEIRWTLENTTKNKKHFS